VRRAEAVAGGREGTESGPWGCDGLLATSAAAVCCQNAKSKIEHRKSKIEIRIGMTTLYQQIEQTLLVLGDELVTWLGNDRRG
jgi:hypothetical protein